MVMRSPVVHLHVAITDGNTACRHSPHSEMSLIPPESLAAAVTFAVKVDVKMTVEYLCQHGLSVYSAYCVDSGLPFDPPSDRPEDYDLYFCTADGTPLPDAPLFVAGTASPLRTQLSLSNIHPPYHLIMVPGRMWTQRHVIEVNERLDREAIGKQQAVFVERATIFGAVSARKAHFDHRTRERHMMLVEEVEQALFDATTANNERALAMQQTAVLLNAARATWQAEETRRSAAAETLLAVKRRFYAASEVAVRVWLEALSQRASESGDASLSVLLTSPHGAGRSRSRSILSL